MDMLLLSALAHRQRYRTLHHVVPTGMLSPDTVVMLAWYGAYWVAFPEREHIVVDELISLVRIRSGNASPEQIAVTLRLCEGLRRPIDEASLRGILGQLHELDLSGRAAALVSQYNAGMEVNLAYELNKLSAQVVRAMSQSAPTDYCDTPIEDILAEIDNDFGIKFRTIGVLRDNIAGLQGGASIGIAARPDKGKTSLIARIITDWAPQLEAVFGTGRPILWFNNEGSSKRIVPRVYQAALQCDLAQLTHYSNTKVLTDMYAKAVGGTPDIIRVKDMHGASLAQAEQIIEAIRPAVVVYDMAANFRMAGGSSGANKADQVEQIWQCIREMAVQHDHIAISTVQISAEGGNMLWPPYSALKDSKTGIQGATDILLMLGSMDDIALQSLRGISTPKNKFAIAGKQSYVKGEVAFDGSKCAFNDGSSGGSNPA